MKKKIGLVVISVVMLLSTVVVGCEGIAQELYDQVMAQLDKAKADLEKAKAEKDELQQTKEEIESNYNKAEETITELEALINSLKERYEPTDETLAEMAERIVKYYHDTHVYSKTDLFVCSDMSAEVWNMLKAQGIKSVIVVGNKDAVVSDIVLCNHAWVRAEVDNGEYLALETTGGYSVSKGENPLYYRGWTFETPSGLNDYTNLVREYNTLVGVRNRINEAVNYAVEMHNNSTNPTEADKWQTVYDKMVELCEEYESKLLAIRVLIDSLATPYGT